MLWIAGALADGPDAHAALAGRAGDRLRRAAVHVLGPGPRRLPPSAWDLETSHFAERFQLFVILALGESIVVTGATASGEELNAARLAAFTLAFLGTAAMWWLYFNYAAAIAQRRLELAENRTLLARDAYTYLHVVIVAGVIVSAVGDELVLAHPTEVLPRREIAAVVRRPGDLPAGARAVPAAAWRAA